MLFDIRTLVAVMAITTLVSAITLFLFWRLLPEERGLRPAVFGAACQSLATILILLRGQIADVLSIFVSNILLLLSYALLYQTMRIFCGKTTEWRLPATIIIALAPVFLFFPGNEYLGMRVIASAIGIGSLCFLIALVLYRERQQQLPARRGVAIAFAGASVCSLIRIVVTLKYPPGDIHFLDKSDDSLIFIWGIILAFIYAFSIIMMTSERLRESLKQKLNDEQKAHQVAERALQEQRAFVTMLSHEFRTPLAIIRANTDAITLLSDHQNNDIDTSVERINRANLRLTTLVNGCLNNDRVQNLLTDSQETFSDVNLTCVLQEVADEYDVQLHGDNRSSIVVQGDRDLLFILFSNLINNAIKHSTDRRNIEFSWYLDAHAVHIDVADDGPGIAAEAREKIFEKYFRINADKRTPGTGLGLYFVRVIAGQHHGKARLVDGDSTRFRISLPLKENT
ncbi:MAG: HAMP domain-containing histidine kinase [Gammaproteobacteria bacterium]|nr:HAMP domain-containing histidine kinase [Gammaproteobacteria bacterium]